MNPHPVILAQTADQGILGFLHTMRGPDFLLLFGVWFLVTFGGVLLFRWRGQDTPFTTITGLAGYELLGIVRIIDGSAHGMHNWGFLILMMIIGGIIFLIRAEHFENTGNDGSGGSWWNSNSSGGSSGCSSGGGGCGGGGGGCGGCGGG